MPIEKPDCDMLAWLALVDGILVPTTHFPRVKIVKEHVEMTENLDEFLAYPWGRLSFDRMMYSIKERDLGQLATADVAVQGLFYALQMVVCETVPSILGVNSGDESDTDEEFLAEASPVPQLKLSHIRQIDDSSGVSNYFHYAFIIYRFFVLWLVMGIC